jgi:hypothetical protein
VENDGAHHGAAACRIDRGRAAHVPEHVLGLRAVDEDDAAGCSSVADGKTARCLEHPHGVRIALGIQSQIRSGDQERTACGFVDAGSEDVTPDLAMSASEVITLSAAPLKRQLGCGAERDRVWRLQK